MLVSSCFYLYKCYKVNVNKSNVKVNVNVNKVNHNTRVQIIWKYLLDHAGT